MANEQAGVPERKDWAGLRPLEGDALKVQYRHLLTVLGKKPSPLGVIFKKVRNKIQKPTRLQHLLALMDRENESGLGFDVKGEIHEGLRQKNAEDVKGAACVTAGLLLVACDYLVDTYGAEMDREQLRFLRQASLLAGFSRAVRGGSASHSRG